MVSISVINRRVWLSLVSLQWHSKVCGLGTSTAFAKGKTENRDLTGISGFEYSAMSQSGKIWLKILLAGIQRVLQAIVINEHGFHFTDREG